MIAACGTCGERADVRPYGKGGALICFPCMKADPAREAEARRQLGALLEGPGPHVLTDRGPRRVKS